MGSKHFVGGGGCVGAEDGFEGANSAKGRRKISIAKWKRIVLYRTLQVSSKRVEAPKLGSARECGELHERLGGRKAQTNPSRSHTQTLFPSSS